MKNRLIPVFALLWMLVPSVGRLAHAADAGYDKGFFILSDDKNFKFQLNIRFQPIWKYAFKEAQLDETTFGNSTIRTIFKGHAFSPKYNYYLSLEYNSEAGKPTLKDGFVALELTDPFKIQVGQYWVPINREEMYSGIGSNLVSNSVMMEHFALARDIGVTIYGDILKNPLTYYVFFINGDGQNKDNKDKNFLLGTRLEYTVMGEMSGYQGDINYSENPNLGFGGTIAYNFGSASETADFDVFNQQGLSARQDRLIRGDLDGSFTWMGASLFGQWQFVHNNEFRSIDHGFMGQAGYFIIPKHLEAVGRYSVLFPDIFPALTQSGVIGASGTGKSLLVKEAIGLLRGRTFARTLH